MSVERKTLSAKAYDERPSSPRRPFRMPRSFPLRHRGPPSVNVPLTVGLAGSGVTSEDDCWERRPAFPTIDSLTVGLTGTGVTSEGDCWERRPAFSTIIR